MGGINGYIPASLPKNLTENVGEISRIENDQRFLCEIWLQFRMDVNIFPMIPLDCHWFLFQGFPRIKKSWHRRVGNRIPNRLRNPWRYDKHNPENP